MAQCYLKGLLRSYARCCCLVSSTCRRDKGDINENEACRGIKLDPGLANDPILNRF